MQEGIDIMVRKYKHGKGEGEVNLKLRNLRRIQRK
jgi:hypothetical protein